MLLLLLPLLRLIQLEFVLGPLDLIVFDKFQVLVLLLNLLQPLVVLVEILVVIIVLVILLFAFDFLNQILQP
ncbi:MAG: hypothetical protein CMH03_09785 [Marinovum sp.]|nr:hypothetical protein [Marinovum sp.]